MKGLLPTFVCFLAICLPSPAFPQNDSLAQNVERLLMRLNETWKPLVMTGLKLGEVSKVLKGGDLTKTTPETEVIDIARQSVSHVSNGMADIRAWLETIKMVREKFKPEFVNGVVTRLCVTRVVIHDNLEALAIAAKIVTNGVALEHIATARHHIMLGSQTIDEVLLLLEEWLKQSEEPEENTRKKEIDARRDNHSPFILALEHSHF